LLRRTSGVGVAVSMRNLRFEIGEYRRARRRLAAKREVRMKLALKHFYRNSRNPFVDFSPSCVYFRGRRKGSS
jgi:hypothetical protein